MDHKKGVYLLTLCVFILSYDALLIAYLFYTKFNETIIQIFGFLFFLLSLLINPIILVIFAKQTTQLSVCRFNARLIIFVPAAIFLANTFLVFIPAILKKLMRVVGVTDTRIIAYTAAVIFIGKIATTGLLDLFCQTLIIGNNIASADSLEYFDFAFIAGDILVTLLLCIFVCCFGKDSIKSCMGRYFSSLDLEQSLLEPIEVQFSDKIKQESCAICLERFTYGEILSNLPTCEHSFHKNCLNRWMEYKKACPLCRSEG
ncbi:unnamed protein product [Blepharisma stoltei]|uniref:RING-type domain-containing protein n=1 Tax=Blepharisma stoltei TaxID=1481888 RepID=A0AAU9K1Y9_9CILI|nr:unnamed protein product [Blepharisma stoltei]